MARNLARAMVAVTIFHGKADCTISDEFILAWASSADARVERIETFRDNKFPEPQKLLS